MPASCPPPSRLQNPSTPLDLMPQTPAVSDNQPDTASQPCTSTTQANVTWFDLGYPTNAQALAVSTTIDWNDSQKLFMAISDKNTALFQFGTLILTTKTGCIKMTKSVFVCTALRHIFRPAYFVNRNVFGRTSKNAPQKNTIDPGVYQALCGLAQVLCPYDETPPGKIKDGVHHWLRSRKFTDKLKDCGLV